MPCSTPGIPNNLHRSTRVIDADFSQDYKLFLRVRPDHIIEDTDEYGNNIAGVSAYAFTLNKQSCNRDKYSVPRDVLYNINAKTEDDHFRTWGVVSLGITELTVKRFKHPDLEKFYKLNPVHVPEECMYPHSEIYIYDVSEASRLHTDISSKRLKAEIRGHYLDVLTIEIQPSR